MNPKNMMFTAALSVLLVTSLAYAGSRDPLEANELNLAKKLAVPAPGVVASTRSLRSHQLLGAASIEENSETLLVERHPGDKNSNRRLADVYVYHYDTNELERRIVDLDTSEITRVERTQGNQLPLTGSEIKKAKEILFKDDEQFPLINAEYRRIIGQPLKSLDQVNLKAFVFHAESLPQQVNEASAQCGLRRCAQILIYTPENIVFDASPIIDLSAGVVTQVIGF